MTLAGPVQALAHFHGVLASLSQLLHNPRAAHLHSERALWPIFVFSHGRAATAQLNWSAAHAIAGAEMTFAVVLAPDNVSAYRARWPALVFFILPRSGRGLAYARFVLKRAMQTVTPYYW